MNPVISIYTKLWIVPYNNKKPISPSLQAWGYCLINIIAVVLCMPSIKDLFSDETLPTNEDTYPADNMSYRGLLVVSQFNLSPIIYQQDIQVRLLLLKILHYQVPAHFLGNSLFSLDSQNSNHILFVE